MKARTGGGRGGGRGGREGGTIEKEKTMGMKAEAYRQTSIICDTRYCTPLCRVQQYLECMLDCIIYVLYVHV